MESNLKKIVIVEASLKNRFLLVLKMNENKSNLSFSYRTFDPQSMVIFGCIGARFMPFEKLFLKCLPGQSFLNWLQQNKNKKNKKQQQKQKTTKKLNKKQKQSTIISI